MRFSVLWLIVLAAMSACGGPPEPQPPASTPPAAPAPEPPKAPYHVYVTNEVGGDLTVIDGGTNQVVATIPLGKRPRGIRVSPDGTQLFIALSGSPIAPPGVDESKLPPPDRKADGIGIVDIGTRKTFADLGQTIAEVFGVGPLDHGSSFLASILVGEERTGETRKEKG